MTTIVLSERTQANRGLYQVFGQCQDQTDRFTFDIRNYADKDKAEAAARRMMLLHGADHFQRIK